MVGEITGHYLYQPILISHPGATPPNRPSPQQLGVQWSLGVLVQFAESVTVTDRTFRKYPIRFLSEPFQERRAALRHRPSGLTRGASGGIGRVPFGIRPDQHAGSSRQFLCARGTLEPVGVVFRPLWPLVWYGRGG